jgi:hypothetical protein
MEAWPESGVAPYTLDSIINAAPAASSDAPVDTNVLLLIASLDDITPPFMASATSITRMDFSATRKSGDGYQILKTVVGIEI